MEYLLGALVVTAVISFVVLPLLRTRRPAPSTIVQTTSRDERAEIYQELIELELDQRVGKLAEADYRELSDALLARAAALISEEDAQTAALEDQIEREIAAIRASLRTAPEAADEKTASVKQARP